MLPYDAGTLVVNGGLGIEAARTLVSDGVADAASFGVHFIANPGLVELVKGGKGTGDLNQGGWDMKLWWVLPSAAVVGQ